MFDLAMFIIQMVATAVCFVLIPVFIALTVRVLKGDNHE